MTPEERQKFEAEVERFIRAVTDEPGAITWDAADEQLGPLVEQIEKWRANRPPSPAEGK